MDRNTIEHEYRRLGYRLGWRFMTAPTRNLERAAVAIITLNPGGTAPHGPDWSAETGSAYVAESWDGRPTGADPLQRQVQRLCAVLGTTPDDVFSAHFVPFRSPDWASLPRRPDAVAFARRLWAWAGARTAARTVVCVGKTVVGSEIATVFGARLERTVAAGWGEQSIDRYVAADGRIVLGLPHLGRFKLFGRSESEAAFRSALGG